MIQQYNFKCNTDDPVDKRIYNFLSNVKKGEKTYVIKAALLLYLNEITTFNQLCKVVDNKKNGDIKAFNMIFAQINELKDLILKSNVSLDTNNINTVSSSFSSSLNNVPSSNETKDTIINDEKNEDLKNIDNSIMSMFS